MLTDTLTDNATDTATDTDKPTDTDTSTNKRVIPRSDDKIVRLDVRFPKFLHDEIEALAIANGSPIHHISKRPTLTPTILDLIRLGLDNYSPEALERIQVKIESDKISKVLTDNCNDLEALKAELTADILLKIASQQQQQTPTLDPVIEARLDAMEAALSGKS
ncbi:hypothetical protein [Planktothrix agardhii]|uniref:hypothetical protein n=1 Tax=Planktothrix agardhii TaxID=1160 RepID=UPI001D0A0E48|nr:hypothetical protein [Planktothrix agardhii]MCB8762191.1 hypothetical protein [Planktothrix agardhii 1813]